MNRRRKVLASGLVVVLAILAFTAPLLFRQIPATSASNGKDSGSEGEDAGGSGPDTSPPSPSPEPPGPVIPTPKWQGWKGFCHGQGKHLGIIKMAQLLGVNLPGCA